MADVVEFALYSSEEASTQWLSGNSFRHVFIAGFIVCEFAMRKNVSSNNSADFLCGSSLLGNKAQSSLVVNEILTLFYTIGTLGLFWRNHVVSPSLWRTRIFGSVSFSGRDQHQICSGRRICTLTQNFLGLYLGGVLEYTHAASELISTLTFLTATNLMSTILCPQTLFPAQLPPCHPLTDFPGWLSVSYRTHVGLRGVINFKYLAQEPVGVVTTKRPTKRSTLSIFPKPFRRVDYLNLLFTHHHLIVK